MTLGTKYGLDLDLDLVPSPIQLRDDVVLFSESNTRFLVEVDSKKVRRFESLTRKIPCGMLGEVRSDGRFIIRRGNHVAVSMDVLDLRAAWKKFVEVA